MPAVKHLLLLCQSFLTIRRPFGLHIHMTDSSSAVVPFIAIGPAPHRKGPQSRKSAPRSLQKSAKTPKRGEKSDFRLFSGSFETPRNTLVPLRTLSGLFSDSSGILGPKGPRRPCVGWGRSQSFQLALSMSLSKLYLIYSGASHHLSSSWGSVNCP